MPHPEHVTAIITDNEPPNGTRLVVIGERESKVIWRDDDAQAEVWGKDDPHKQRWLDDHEGEPMALREHIKYADAVYALGEPLATFSGVSETV
jgi:hypothetical protein